MRRKPRVSQLAQNVEEDCTNITRYFAQRDNQDEFNLNVKGNSVLNKKMKKKSEARVR